MNKNLLVTIFFLLNIPHLVVAMANKNWVPMPQHGSCKNCCVIWKGTDTQEMVIIRFCPTTGFYSGKRIRHQNPMVEMPLRKEEVQNYLVELNELHSKG